MEVTYNSRLSGNVLFLKCSFCHIHTCISQSKEIEVCPSYASMEVFGITLWSSLPLLKCTNHFWNSQDTRNIIVCIFIYKMLTQCKFLSCTLYLFVGHLSILPNCVTFSVLVLEIFLYIITWITESAPRISRQRLIFHYSRFFIQLLECFTS